MTNFKIHIIFLLARSRINQLGRCSIKCRITYKKKRREFATGLFINSKYWYSKLQQAKPPNDDNNNINTQLSLIKSKINRAFLLLQVQEFEFDVDDVFNQFLGKNFKSEKTLLYAFDNHNSIASQSIHPLSIIWFICSLILKFSLFLTE